VFVVAQAGVKAVVKLTEEFVEQVSLGLLVPVSGGAAGVVVTACSRRGAQRSQGPDRADSGQHGDLPGAVVWRAVGIHRAG